MLSDPGFLSTAPFSVLSAPIHRVFSVRSAPIHQVSGGQPHECDHDEQERVETGHDGWQSLL